MTRSGEIDLTFKYFYGKNSWIGTVRQHYDIQSGKNKKADSDVHQNRPSRVEPSRNLIS